MKSLIKKILKEISPPLIIRIFNKLKLFFKKEFQTSFDGVYDNLNDIEDELPWSKQPWIDAQNLTLNNLNLSKKGELQEQKLTDFELIPSLLISSLAYKSKCNIFDVGGGTGLTFFKMAPYIKEIKNVNYHIFDNQELARSGRNFLEKVKHNLNIFFHEKIEDNYSFNIDFIFINSSIQYIYEYELFLEDIINLSPKYIVITQLPCGEFKTFFSKQNQRGYNTPIIFFNKNDFLKVFANNGYGCICDFPVDELYMDSFFKNFPDDHKIKNTRNFVFEKL